MAGHEVPPPEVKVLHIWNRSRRNVVCNLVTSGEKESGIGETLTPTPTPTPTPMPHAALPCGRGPCFCRVASVNSANGKWGSSPWEGPREDPNSDFSKKLNLAYFSTTVPLIYIHIFLKIYISCLYDSFSLDPLNRSSKLI